MGTDIQGWVERKSLNEWEGILNIYPILGRWIEGFGSMFLYEGDFQPIAEGRGLPEDLSEEAKRDYPEDCWGHTWAYWHEIAAIDWDEIYHETSPRVMKYRLDDAGHRHLISSPLLREIVDPPNIDFSKEGETVIDNVLYKVKFDRPIRRRETLHPGWEIVFKVMAHLGGDKPVKSENLRIVVWFG